MRTIQMNCALRRCESKLHESVHAQKRANCARVLLCFQENDVAKAPVGTEVVFSCWRASVLARIVVWRWWGWRLSLAWFPKKAEWGKVRLRGSWHANMPRQDGRSKSLTSISPRAQVPTGSSAASAPA